MLHHHHWTMPVMNNHLDNQISSLNIHLWSSIGTKPTDGHWLNSITRRKFYFAKTINCFISGTISFLRTRAMCPLVRTALYIQICIRLGIYEIGFSLTLEWSRRKFNPYRARDFSLELFIKMFTNWGWE